MSQTVGAMEEMVEERPVMEAVTQARLDALLADFRKTHVEVMSDLPICNHNIEVEAVDFQPIDGGWVGVIMTPWFMKYFFLADDKDAWADKECGTKAYWTFPAGELKCLVDHLDAAGSYISYSLYSPMGNFKTQESARKTAVESMELLMTPAPVEGEEEVAEPEAEEEQGMAAKMMAQLKGGGGCSSNEDVPKSESRRALFRGLVGRGAGHGQP